MAGYSLMFNVDAVATGLRYGVEIRDRKTMLKAYQQCFTGGDALEWLTLHALKAFMSKEGANLNDPPNERLRILARSAALLLAQRLLETEVFRQVSKVKHGNAFDDPHTLFRFREDEKAGPVLNTRHVWNCRARPPVIVAADLLHKAMLLHLRSGPPDESCPEWKAFMEVAEELQMVEISLLFRRAEVAFFLNLHNALMLHTHLHRQSPPGESLRGLRSKLLRLHQYRVGGQFYCMETMQQRLLKAKRQAHPPSSSSSPPHPAQPSGPEPRIHFALSLGAVSSPDVRLYSVDTLDQDLNAAARAVCARDVTILSNTDTRGVKTVYLPKIFKWHAKDFGANKTEILAFCADFVPEALGAELRGLIQAGATVKIKYQDFDWRRRPYGRPP